jgi:galacturan 1,4-alpha-galacturonidase
MRVFLQSLLVVLPLLSFSFASPNNKYGNGYRKTCVVSPSLNGTDDAPAILHAFKECGNNGHIILKNGTFNINSIMNTTNLRNCDIDIHGYMLWSTNVTYWLANSMLFGYQNQSSAWWLGGDNIHVRGFGYGTLDGNGQTWYDYARGVSNYPRRPQAITIWKTTNSVIEGLRLVQSQMWYVVLEVVVTDVAHMIS